MPSIASARSSTVAPCPASSRWTSATKIGQQPVVGAAAASRRQSSERSSAVLESSTATMLERVSSGENLIGYNILGSYALTRAKKDSGIGVAFTTDSNLVLSRLADFYGRLRSMPFGRPGALTREEYLDIVAYALQRNGYPAGDTTLTLQLIAQWPQIRIERPGSNKTTP